MKPNRDIIVYDYGHFLKKILVYDYGHDKYLTYQWWLIMTYVNIYLSFQSHNCFFVASFRMFLFPNCYMTYACTTYVNILF